MSNNLCVKSLKNLKRKQCEEIIEKYPNLENFFGSNVWNIIIKKLRECAQCEGFFTNWKRVVWEGDEYSDDNPAFLCKECVRYCVTCDDYYGCATEDEHENCPCVHDFREGRCNSCKISAPCTVCKYEAGYFLRSGFNYKEFGCSLCRDCFSKKQLALIAKMYDVLIYEHLIIADLCVVIQRYIIDKPLSKYEKLPE